MCNYQILMLGSKWAPDTVSTLDYTEICYFIIGIVHNAMHTKMYTKDDLNQTRKQEYFELTLIECSDVTEVLNEKKSKSYKIII